MRTLAIDPGKSNTWFVCYQNRAIAASGKLNTPNTLDGCLSLAWLQRIRGFYSKMQLGQGDEIVIERYMHRGGSGGNVSEIMGALIWTLATVARQMGFTVVLITAAAHKNSYNKHHTSSHPTTLIRKLGERHGTWRPKLQRLDPCQHVMDAGTLGSYRILKREGRI